VSTTLPARIPTSGGPVIRAALWLARTVGALVTTPTEHSPGRDFHVPYGVDPGYEPADSMSAFAAFPWVRACVMAIAEDLSGLPVVVKRGKGKKAVRVDDHPVIALLDNPNTQTDAQLYRMQLVVDLELTGTKYELMLSASQRRMDPAALERLHPQRTKPVTNERGKISGFLYDGGGELTTYDAGAVLYGRLPSWEDDARSLLGTGAIQSLHDELTAELAASKRAAEQAKRGRPDAIAAPAKDDDVWTSAQAEAASKAINDAFTARHGGVAVLRGGVKVEPLGWSPREMEFGAQRTLTRESVLAVFGVPPTRLQLPTANYAQSTDAMRQYWQGLVAKAKRYTDAWTKLARMMPGGRPDDTVELDFSGVVYLQEDRTARLARVSTHILNGMSPTAAYAYEGFDDAPIEDPEPPKPGAPPPPPDRGNREEDPEENEAAPAKATRAKSAPRMPRPVAEADRLAVWKGWAARLQEPVEQQLRLAAARYLRGAQQRYIAKVLAELAKNEQRATGTDGIAPIRKDLAEAILIALVGDASEAAHLRGALGDVLTRAIERAFRATARQMGEALDWNPGASPAEQFLGELVTGVTGRTRDMVGEVVRRGLDQGLSAVDIARSLQTESRIFGPQRALNIARTESTRALNAGSTDAMSAAQRNGVAVRKEWLSARDGHVRPAHAALDGMVVGMGQKFVVPMGVEHAGAAAEYPGDFSAAAMVCNCRCTVLPVVD
jgi:HK97 family phage portal protein